MLERQSKFRLFRKWNAKHKGRQIFDQERSALLKATSSYTRGVFSTAHSCCLITPLVKCGSLCEHGWRCHEKNPPTEKRTNIRDRSSLVSQSEFVCVLSWIKSEWLLSGVYWETHGSSDVGHNVVTSIKMQSVSGQTGCEATFNIGNSLTWNLCAQVREVKFTKIEECRCINHDGSLNDNWFKLLPYYLITSNLDFHFSEWPWGLFPSFCSFDFSGSFWISHWTGKEKYFYAQQ